MKRFLALAALTGAGAAHADTLTLDQLTAIVEAQQEQIDTLQADAGSGSATHIGGYGELHLTLNDSGSNEIDFHRFVLLFGHDFTPRLRLRAELELEHAFIETTEVEGDDDNGDGQIDDLEVERTPGELELEQAYIEYDLASGSSVRGGVMLVPVGILNETHEPPTFYGVERNRVESNVIPATWWEGGAGVSQRFGDTGVSADLMVHSGLATDLSGSNPIRSGRQKVAEATADDWAVTGRVRYQGIAGLDLAASAQYQQDLSQVADDGVDDATLITAHAIYSHGIFGVRALFAQWDINGSAASAQNRDSITGWYVEPSVRPGAHWGVFARYSAVELTRGEEETNLVAGVSLWPHDNVVIKADVTRRDNPDASESNSVNLGLGYQF